MISRRKKLVLLSSVLVPPALFLLTAGALVWDGLTDDAAPADVAVVSQYFHISRSRLAFKRFGIAPVYSAHAELFELRDIYSTAREVPAYFVYLLKRVDTPRGINSR